MGRHGKILNPRSRFLLFVCFFLPAARRDGVALLAACKPQCVGNRGVQNLPSRSERAGQHSRECVSVRCGLRRHDAVAQGGLRWRCGGRRVRFAMPPVLPDGGRPVGTAWKDFESGVSSPVLPPAARRVRRRCDCRGGFARRGCGIAASQRRGICGVYHFPSRSRRERASAADAF